MDSGGEPSVARHIASTFIDTRAGLILIQTSWKMSSVFFNMLSSLWRLPVWESQFGIVFKSSGL